MAKCVLCNKRVKGYYHEVKLTLCCKECCENASTDIGPKLCRPGRAASEFNLRSEHLALLYCAYERNPRYRSGPIVRLYAIAEVKFLSQQIAAIREAKEVLKRQRCQEELVQKRQRLEKRHRIYPNEMPAMLRPFVFGDYLRNAKSKTLLRDIRKRYGVKDKAHRIMKNGKAHPKVALDYCLDNPEADVEEYLQLKENMRRVFSMEGDKVLKSLTISDHATLKHTPLKDVLEEFKNPQRNNSN